MRLRPMIKWYGSKWTLAPRYHPPMHDLIIEPFAGSAQYALLYYDRDVLLVDLDERICAAWQWMIDASPEDVLSLPDVPEGQDVREMGLPFGAMCLVWSWLSIGAMSNTKPSSMMMQHIAERDFNGSLWGAAVRRRIARQLPMIRHWKVLHGSYEDIPNCEATWFIDPPYQQGGEAYRRSSHGIDFSALASWCHGREGQVIVCERSNADWLPFEPLAKAAINSVTSHAYTEGVWYQNSVDTQTQLFA